jgi:hypothetical protein
MAYHRPTKASRTKHMSMRISCTRLSIVHIVRGEHGISTANWRSILEMDTPVLNVVMKGLRLDKYEARRREEKQVELLCNLPYTCSSTTV